MYSENNYTIVCRLCSTAGEVFCDFTLWPGSVR